MAVLKRRSRIVSIRLSEQEYQRLRSCCLNRGARSISDLARDAMQRLLARSEADGNGGEGTSSYDDGYGLAITVESLHGRMEQLDHEVKRLASLVAKRAAGAEGAL